MRKIRLFSLLAFCSIFVACSLDESLYIPEQVHKGMELRASVDQTEETRATFGIQGPDMVFGYDFNDQIKVTNEAVNQYYTFKKVAGFDHTLFSSEDAQTTALPAVWYAYFPSTDISLISQSGILDDAANRYVMAGATSGTTTGAGGLSVMLEPHVAFLQIRNFKGDIDINIKTSSTTWLKGMRARKNEKAFDVVTSDVYQTILSASEVGATYYIAVPAGIQLSIKDGNYTVKSTTAGGLKAGRSYIVDINARANINGQTKEVKWVQLWENGPKFAECNVGVTEVSELDCGGLYTWGGYVDAHVTVDPYYKNTLSKLTGQEDTATRLWGSDWRMPTHYEFSALYEKCTYEWKSNYNGVAGVMFTGKGAYSDQSVFFPAGGSYLSNWGGFQGYLFCSYWSSSVTTSPVYMVYMSCVSGDAPKNNFYSNSSGTYFSVRAVLNDKPVTKGSALANINGRSRYVNWTQLWENGPKFAEYNVGVTDYQATSYGGRYCWGKSVDGEARENAGRKENTDLSGTSDTATNLWGSNWRMPTRTELENLAGTGKCRHTWVSNYKGSGVSGMLFQGLLGTYYEDNSVFFPAAGAIDCYGHGEVSEQNIQGNYWSTRSYGLAYAFTMVFSSSVLFVPGTGRLRDEGYSVRAVLVD